MVDFIALSVGHIYELESGVTVAIVNYRGRDSYQGLVVKSTNDSYPVGGYDIIVFVNNVIKKVELP